MKRRDYFILFLFGVVVHGAFALLQKVPGYMDAEYYFGQGIQLVTEHNLNEPFIWNYLNNPAVMPVAGFSFWLPFTSFLSAAGTWLTGSTSFIAGRILFILIAAAIAPITAKLAYYFSGKKRVGWLAGGLAIFSGLFFPYLTITDTFTPFMFLGALFLLLLLDIQESQSSARRVFFLCTVLGIITGLMTLTRSDGILWLAGGFLGIVLINKKTLITKKTFLFNFLFILGFSLVMLPWYLRNYQLYGTGYPPGNGLMLWLTKYDNLFVYPYSLVNKDIWMSQNYALIINDRLTALWSNLKTLFSAGGVIILWPLMAVGFWQNRKKIPVIVGIVMLAIIFLVMSIIFPYAGERGGFFHSLSSIQPLLWAFVPCGLDGLIQWGVDHRNWKTDRAWRMFGSALVVLAGCLSVFIMFTKVKNGVEGVPWNETQKTAQLVDAKIVEMTDNQSGIVMVNNPPGYTLATGRLSVMIPSGGAEAVLSVCNKYSVIFLVVDNERSEIKNLLVENGPLDASFKILYENGSVWVYEYQP